MANRYLKATGIWADNNTWSATDGGAAGATYPVAGDAVLITASGNGLTLTLAAAAASDSFVCSGANNATLAGTQTLTVGGNVTLLATMTIPNTITFVVTGTGAFAGSTLATLGAVNLNGTAHTVSGAFTNTVLTRNGTATKTDSISFTSGTTVTCTTCAMIGNSATNRLLMQASTLGTAATITATNWTGTVNVDIMDITATNAVDLSAITGNSGDCGGNTGITFTTTAAQAWTNNAGGSWSGANWTSRVPLPQDDVTFPLQMQSAKTITVDMPRIGKSVDFSGMTWTGTATSIVFSVANGYSVFGSFILKSGVTWSQPVGPERAIILCGRGTTYSLNSAGLTMGRIYWFAPTGIYQLAADLTFSITGTTGADLLLNGTFDLNGHNVTSTCFNSFGSAARSLIMGTGTWTIAYTDATTVWKLTATGMTFTANQSTIIISNSGTNAQTFAGGGLAYYNVTVAGAGAYALTISGSNSFTGTFTVDRSQAAKTITTTDGTTQTFTNAPVLAASGTNVLTLGGTGTGGWTWTKNSAEYLGSDYISVSYGTANTANKWFAGSHGTDGGHNSGWVFTDLLVNSAVGAMTAAGIAIATPECDANVLAATAVLALDGISPTATASALANATTAAMTALGIAPTITAGALVSAATAALTAAGISPASITASALINAATATLTMAGVAPELLVTALGRLLSFMGAHQKITAILHGGGEE